MPSVVFGDDNYLVVWEDTRIDRDIYGSRVSQDGFVLDPTGVMISTAAYRQNASSISYDGTNYFIVWEDYRNRHSDIYGARISETGMVLDSHAIAISTAVGNQGSPVIAFDGINYLVVWQDTRNGFYDIYGARVTQSGIVLDPSGIIISNAGGGQYTPAIAFDGTNFLVVWKDYRGYYGEIYGARVNQSGTLLDTAGILISINLYGSAYRRHPAVAFGSMHYLVAWTEYFGGYAYDIYGTRVSPSGMVIDTAGIAISNAWGPQIRPSITFDGSNYFIVWEDGRDSNFSLDIYGARMNQSGVVLDSNGIAVMILQRNQWYVFTTYNGTSYFVLWQDGLPHQPQDIYGAKVDTTGLVIDSFIVAVKAGNQISPVCALGADNHILITYSGFVDSINTHPANTMRIWGKFFPFIGIEEDARCSTPNALRLFQVYPNPFSKSTVISYSSLVGSTELTEVINDQLPVTNDLQCPALRIYDVTGRMVKQFTQLLNDQLPNDQIIWDGSDDFGRKLPNGVYFIRLKTKEQSETKKVIFVK